MMYPKLKGYPMIIYLQIPQSNLTSLYIKPKSKSLTAFSTFFLDICMDISGEVKQGLIPLTILFLVPLIILLYHSTSINLVIT